MASHRCIVGDADSCAAVTRLPCILYVAEAGVPLISSSNADKAMSVQQAPVSTRVLNMLGSPLQCPNTAVLTIAAPELELILVAEKAMLDIERTGLSMA